MGFARRQQLLLPQAAATRLAEPLDTSPMAKRQGRLALRNGQPCPTKNSNRLSSYRYLTRRSGSSIQFSIKFVVVDAVCAKDVTSQALSTASSALLT
jgi:hypothetical protein